MASMKGCQTQTNVLSPLSPAIPATELEGVRDMPMQSSHEADLEHAISHSPQEQPGKPNCPRCCENTCMLKKIKETATVNPRSDVVTESQLASICHEVGTCWCELGPKLDISASKIYNINEEYRGNWHKANALLILWKQQKGSNATVSHLADVLEKIGRRSIAEKLLGDSKAFELPTCAPVSTAGDVISLTVNAMQDKELHCEDAHGNKFIVKAVTRSIDQCHSEEVQKNKILDREAVTAQDMEKTEEQKLQERLKRYSLRIEELTKEVEGLRWQFKQKVDCADYCGETSTTISSTKKDAQPSEVPEKVQQQDAVQLLVSCEEHKANFKGIYYGLIDRIGELKQLGEDNVMCIKHLFASVKEFRDGVEKIFVPKVTFLHSMKQQLDENHAAQVEELEQWSKTQKKQLGEVEKLLSSMLCQGKISRCQSESRVTMMSSSGTKGKGLRTYSFKGSSKSQTIEERLYSNQKCDDISAPFCSQQMSSIYI